MLEIKFLEFELTERAMSMRLGEVKQYLDRVRDEGIAEWKRRNPPGLELEYIGMDIDAQGNGRLSFIVKEIANEETGLFQVAAGDTARHSGASIKGRAEDRG